MPYTHMGHKGKVVAVSIQSDNIVWGRELYFCETEKSGEDVLYAFEQASNKSQSVQDMMSELAKDDVKCHLLKPSFSFVHVPKCKLK